MQIRLKLDVQDKTILLLVKGLLESHLEFAKLLVGGLAALIQTDGQRNGLCIAGIRFCQDASKLEAAHDPCHHDYEQQRKGVLPDVVEQIAESHRTKLSGGSPDGTALDPLVESTWTRATHTSPDRFPLGAP